MERIILDVTYLAELRTTETGIRPKDKFGSDVFHRGFLMFLRLMETQSKTSDRSNSRQTQVYSEVPIKFAHKHKQAVHTRLPGVSSAIICVSHSFHHSTPCMGSSCHFTPDNSMLVFLGISDLQEKNPRIEEEGIVIWKRLKRSLHQPRLVLLTCLISNRFE